MYKKKDIDTIAIALRKMKESVAVAESVTSGHLQAAFSLADFAQEFYQGGLTVYNIGQKSRHLNIEPIHAIQCNCVSKRVAEQMALGVTQAFSSDWGLAVCGYAAPVPELKVKIPFAFFAIARQSVIKSSGKLETTTRSGRPTQEYFTAQILRAFERLLKTR